VLTLPTVGLLLRGGAGGRLRGRGARDPRPRRVGGGGRRRHRRPPRPRAARAGLRLRAGDRVDALRAGVQPLAEPARARRQPSGPARGVYVPSAFPAANRASTRRIYRNFVQELGSCMRTRCASQNGAPPPPPSRAEYYNGVSALDSRTKYHVRRFPRGALLAEPQALGSPGAEVFLAPPCVSHKRFSMQNIQGGRQKGVTVRADRRWSAWTSATWRRSAAGSDTRSVESYTESVRS
jgi:hypothetical protein